MEVCTGRKSVSAIYNPVAGRWNVLGVGTLYKPGMCYFYPLDNDAKLSWIVSVLRWAHDLALKTVITRSSVHALPEHEHMYAGAEIANFHAMMNNVSTWG